MKIKMSVPERLTFLNCLPQKESFAGLKALRLTKEVVSLNAEEVKELNFSYDTEKQMAFWDNEKGFIEKEFDIEEYVVGLVKKNLKKLDDSKQLEPNHMSLYAKIMEVT